jgi:CBS domain-containing protein
MSGVQLEIRFIAHVVPSECNHHERIPAYSVLTVSPEASVEAAIRILLESDVTGLPVVDESGRLCGIFTETDRLNMLLTEKHPAHILVREVMTKGVITVEEDTTIDQINQLLLRANIRRVPVMRDGKIVGVVSRRDLVTALRGGMVPQSIVG